MHRIFVIVEPAYRESCLIKVKEKENGRKLSGDHRQDEVGWKA